MSSTLSRHMKPEHFKATRAFGYALTLAEFEGWAAVSAVWGVRLSQSELAAIAVAALSELDEPAHDAFFSYWERDE